MAGSALVLAAFLVALIPSACDPCSCLPKDIRRDDVVSTLLPHPGGDPGKSAKIGNVTVEQALMEMKARCRRGTLVDTAGRQIRFYRLAGCWGNPPEDYAAILERQRQELEGLKKKYRVVEMTCNPSGEPIL
jgi:hypothetical protein